MYSLEDYISFLKLDVGKIKFENSIQIKNSTTENKTSWITYIKETKMHTSKKEIVFKTRETAILTLINNQWKIRLIHSSNIKG